FFVPPATVSTVAKEAWLIPRFERLFSQREQIITKVVDTATGQMVAFMNWAAPFCLTDAEREERKRAEEVEKAKYGTAEEARAARFAAGTNLDCAEEIFSAFGAMREKWYKENEHYDPAYQKKGLGTLLLNQALGRADREGKQAYLESMEAGHPLYLKLGWVDVELFEVDVRKWGGDRKAPYWVMIRNPRSLN
ncbi:hypothetical protein DH86_00000401, partial [Scytalidium sp. 3C]